MIEPSDGSSTLRNPGKEPIRQFVIYAEHKVGWLNDFVSMLGDENIDILGISVLDTTDSAVIRLIQTPQDLARLLKVYRSALLGKVLIELEKEDSYNWLQHYCVLKLIYIMYTLLCTNPVNQLLQLPWKMKKLLKMCFVHIT